MKFLTSVRTLIIAMVLSIGISYAYAAWAPPSALPTNGNAEAPINVGSATQAKAGALVVGGLFTTLSNVVVGGTVKVGDTTTTAPCTLPAHVGVIKYDKYDGDIKGCIYAGGVYGWKSLTAVGGGGGGSLPPDFTLTASATMVPTGGTVTISWDVTNPSTTGVASCTASNAWTGVKYTEANIAGTQTGSQIFTLTAPGDDGFSPNVDHTFTLTCDGVGGQTVKSVTVKALSWKAVFPQGNLGETCNAYLSRLTPSKAPFSGTQPRTILLDVAGSQTSTIYPNKCAYVFTALPTASYACQNADPTFSAPSLAPTGTCDSRNSMASWPGLLTQTIRETL